MAEESVLAVYVNVEDAKSAIAAILRAGVAKHCVSVIQKGEHLPPPSSKDQEDLREDVGMGAAIGGGVGLLTGSVVALATGLGPLIVAGALAAAVGAASGSLIGLLAGYSISEGDVTSYEDLLRSNHVFVFVRGESSQVARAKAVLEATPTLMLRLHSVADSEDTTSSNAAE